MGKNLLLCTFTPVHHSPMVRETCDRNSFKRREVKSFGQASRERWCFCWGEVPPFGCINLVNNGVNNHINWCNISEPSTVFHQKMFEECLRIRRKWLENTTVVWTTLGKCANDEKKHIWRQFGKGGGNKYKNPPVKVKIAKSRLWYFF